MKSTHLPFVCIICRSNAWWRLTYALFHPYLCFDATLQQHLVLCFYWEGSLAWGFPLCAVSRIHDTQTWKKGCFHVRSLQQFE